MSDSFYKIFTFWLNSIKKFKFELIKKRTVLP
ncbi:hypothetical protein TPHV1_460002 [Treponema phagedenis]|uniref:Uncharacterized protein n=1 Tax=Treponema phagedenis TaxID=162 RepID=A0A0B7H0G6_TREPH|nr:hypothetical protein TPHV1_460002 [Treponema phagedenis]